MKTLKQIKRELKVYKKHYKDLKQGKLFRDGNKVPNTKENRHKLRTLINKTRWEHRLHPVNMYVKLSVIQFSIIVLLFVIGGLF